MTNGAELESRQARCHAWARVQFDLADDAPAAEVRKKFFSLVEDFSFVPPEPSVDAYRFVVGATDGDQPAAVPPSFLIENERQLLSEIDSFRRTLFQLPLVERRAVWRGLTDRARTVPRAAARAELLEPAVHADLLQIPETRPKVRRLAEYAVELFSLPPQTQAMRRRRVVQEMLYELENWESAARRLRASFPKMAAVDPLLLDQVERQSEERDWADTRAKQRQRGPALRSSSSPDFGAALYGLRYVALIVMVASFIGRAVFTSSRPGSTYNPTYNLSPSQQFGSEDFSWDPEDPSNIFISPEDREKLLNKSEEELREEGGWAALILFGLEEEWKRRQAERQRIDRPGPADGTESALVAPGSETNPGVLAPDAVLPSPPSTSPPSTSPPSTPPSTVP